MPFGEPQDVEKLSIAKTGSLEPGECFVQSGNAGVKVARFDFRVSAGRFRHHGIALYGAKGEGFPATLDPAFQIALLNIGRPHAPPAYNLDRFKAALIESNTVL